MVEPTDRASVPSAAGLAADDRLDSWKEIAAYLKRDVSTVQRWEKKEGLPVHRLPHDRLGSVFAFKVELDAWWNRGRQRLEAEEPAPRWNRTKGTLADWPALARETLRVGVATMRASWRRVMAIAVALVLAFLSGVLVMRQAARVRPSEPSNPGAIHLAIPLPVGTTLALEGDTDPAIALSRDGTRIAYVVRQGPTTQIYVRSLDRPDARPVPGTVGARSPFFSPDGRSLGFLDGFKLKKVALETEEVVTLCETGFMRGASWGRDDTIVFARDLASDLWRVSARGGSCERLTARAQSEHSHRLPAFLPGGDRVLFTVGTPQMSTWNEARADLATLTTGDRQHLFEGGTNPRYSASGHLLYSRQGSLFAMPFDAGSERVVGQPVEVLSGVVMSTTGGEAHFALSETGVLAYAAGAAIGMQDRLVWVDRHGREEPISEHRDSFARVRLSPDGRYLACETDRLRIDIWVYDLRRGTMTPLTSEGLFNDMPVWTPDGRRMTYRSDLESQGRPGSRRNVVWRAVDGSAPPERLSSVEEPQYAHRPWSWSPDGDVLAFVVAHFGGTRDIWILRRGEKKLEPLLTGPFNEDAPAFSPDGRWLAYVSDESGRLEVYVRRFPGPGERWLISTGGGQIPRWAKHTGELFYREGHKMMVVDVGASPEFFATRPRMLFGKAAMRDEFDVSADGQRFVMIHSTGTPAPTQIDVIVNWFAELKRRVPVGR